MTILILKLLTLRSIDAERELDGVDWELEDVRWPANERYGYKNKVKERGPTFDKVVGG